MDRTVVSSRVDGRPAVVLVVGVNGTGKTTTVGKLARVLVAEDKDVVLGAADTFRAAAADQLETWGARVGVPTVRSDRDGADPAAVAFDAVKAGTEMEADVVLIDTAGRLHNKVGLMDELGKVKRVIEKQSPIDEVLLVLDATTGQNGLRQAEVFAEVVDVTGIVLTKLDGTAKGGIVVSVQRKLGVPVKLVGPGRGPGRPRAVRPRGLRRRAACLSARARHGAARRGRRGRARRGAGCGMPCGRRRRVRQSPPSVPPAAERRLPDRRRPDHRVVRAGAERPATRTRSGPSTTRATRRGCSPSTRGPARPSGCTPSTRRSATSRRSRSRRRGGCWWPTSATTTADRDGRAGVLVRRAGAREDLGRLGVLGAGLSRRPAQRRGARRRPAHGPRPGRHQGAPGRDLRAARLARAAQGSTG